MQKLSQVSGWLASAAPAVLLTLVAACAPQPAPQAAAPPPPPEPCPCRDNPQPEPKCPEVVASAAPGAPEPKAPPEPEPAANFQVFKLGDTVHQLDFDLTVSAVKECKPRYYEVQSLNRAGHRLVAVEVTFEATTEKPMTPATYNMKLVDSEGLTYKYSYRGTCEPRLPSGTLNQGEKAKGWVTFEVDRNAKGLKLGYDHFAILGPKQIVKYDLGM